MDFGMDNAFRAPFGDGRLFGPSDNGAMNVPSGIGGSSEDTKAVGKSEKVDGEKKPGQKSSPEDCETCKNRKYKDGSDESDVSFQTATHIDPASAGARVRAHEQEHVTNAYSKAAEAGGKVISVGVALHTAVCPECGRTYVSGGVTHSVIAYPNENGGASKIESVNGDPKEKAGGASDKGEKKIRGAKENFNISMDTGAGNSGTQPGNNHEVSGVARENVSAAGNTKAPESNSAAERVIAQRAQNPYAAARNRMAAKRGNGVIFRANI